ncbi:DNA-binding protein [Mycolicibacterium insubricum]|uniref:XRE family transcriptional regulator n=1 Tax=Mycolicibacterium insubricum TaxID=444597 RepID=UPI00138D1EA4|nr:XRE family transcriptional regulator [Mycolicibacterium insubricum]BBZ67295.1 DNA-binding protein [Mycolicibacterium insubricum]
MTFSDRGQQSASISDHDIAKTFDGDRLRQARQLALRTKQSLSEPLGVSAAAVGQYESGATPPRADLIPILARELDVPREFFAAGRPLARLEAADAFFRSLRATTAKQRAKAISYTEQLWELMHAVEKHVRLPPVNLPGFGGGEIEPGAFPSDPVAAARALRKAWRLGTEPIAHLVRTIENQGIVTVLVPFAENEVARIDAFSTLSLSRPIIVLSPDRANDIYRHRFTAAHELGHLVLHGELAGGDPALEREADRFAAEFLTPSLVIHDLLPRRIDFRKLNRLSEQWGVSIKSLIYRCREVGLLSDATARRAYIRLNYLSEQGVIATQPVYQFPGEVPALLRRAVELAEVNGVTITSLAQELAWKPSQVRRMLGDADERPALRLI